MGGGGGDTKGVSRDIDSGGGDGNGRHIIPGLLLRSALEKEGAGHNR